MIRICGIPHISFIRAAVTSGTPRDFGIQLREKRSRTTGDKHLGEGQGHLCMHASVKPFGFLVLFQEDRTSTRSPLGDREAQ